MGLLSTRVARTFEVASGAPAIQFKGEWITWGEVALLVRSLDALLDQLGLGAGAAVGCLLRNWPEHAATMIGVVAGDRCLVTFNAHSPEDRLAQDIAAARAPVVVAAAEDWKRPALRAAVEATGAAGIVLTGDKAAPVAFAPGLETVRSDDLQAPLPGVAILMLTSGTTGTPKRVPLRLDVLERQIADAAGGARHDDAKQEAAPAAAPGVGIMTGNLVHIGGVWGVIAPALSGGAICMLERFNVAEWRAAVVEHRPKSSGGPPTALRMILDADIPREDLSSLVTFGVGTAAVDPAMVDEFMDRYGIAVLPNYGATEFAGGVASWSYRGFIENWAAKRGAVGRVHKTMQARIVDPETGEERPFGEEGVLELRGFAAGDGEAWVRTTDRGVMDADRYLWIKGRIDNAINRGGFKVQPEDVVAALEAHPAIAEAAVVGLPDRRLGQTPAAAVVLRPGAERPSDQALADWVRERLLAYCVPTSFRVVDELPRTPSMKVSAPDVRALFATADA